ncbi:hypothetical protein B0T22DRAFT_377983 [Podospora appendiculata]|uniref:Glycosyl transferase CAP10 domain-containing protein n=1 Tax=Podospora appendiculata TaxID=314037 RepID=A0AAE0XD58_9PEZI|nr:hypothetical protein B0T22DRAFT_377983 [Podospora appendiculata]
MRPGAFPPRRPSHLIRFLIPTVIILYWFYYHSGPETRLLGASTEGHVTDNDVSHGIDSNAHTVVTTTASFPLVFSTTSIASSTSVASSTTSTKAPTPATPAASFATGTHVIDGLIRDAEKVFTDKLSREATSLAEAAAAYRSRRGRHPPPGFKEWYEFAKTKNVVMVEDFWDQIYHDLEPFWALKPARIRKDAWDYEMRITIRGGKASSGSDWFWTKIWLELINTIQDMLPDMDIALNAMDEPRLVVPWEEMNDYMAEADRTRKFTNPADVVSQFQTLPPAGEGPEKDEETPKKNWERSQPYWPIARRGCPPTSPARTAATITNFDTTPLMTSPFTLPHMSHGYVSNFTLSTDFCHQPDLQGLNGIFVEPLSVAATKVLFPMFGGSKLAVNNEILLPAPMYWNEEERFTGAGGNGIPWDEKDDKVVWRGVATGGHNRATNWKAFQRHRFVAMNNATKLARAESRTELPNNFAMPSAAYGLQAQEEGKLGAWVGAWANISFIDLMCAEKESKGAVRCNYTDPYFSVAKGVKMADQFKHKYLPDIDGNSFSGRYLGFLRSTSLPIKATVWREWHDSRLIAWKHFVPMDNRYADWWGIMEYFLGYEGAKTVPGHDEVARAIALAGREWADKVLRKEDMQVYVHRLLLEYARVSSERRAEMGWVEDLVNY